MDGMLHWEVLILLLSSSLEIIPLTFDNRSYIWLVDVSFPQKSLLKLEESKSYQSIISQ